MTDNELMLAVCNGDVDRIGALFDRHNGKLFNFFMKLTRHRETSEDLVQEVFVRMLRYRHTYNGEGAFTTWMFRIGYNCFYDLSGSSNGRMQAADDLDSIPTDPAQFDAVVANERARNLQRALLRIDPKDRAILTMSAYRHMKYREIAEAVGCSEGTIKTRVYRALRQLRKIYTELTGQDRI